MVSLFIRNLFFTLLQPGVVVGLVPFWILEGKTDSIFSVPMKFLHYLGIIVFAGGFVIMLTCIVSFAVQGRGTLSPVDPTKKLVVAGLYKYSRNPMYVGVIMMLIGEAFFFQSLALWMYSFLILVAFHIFIVFVEEPRLKRDFKEEYDKYCDKVGRWF